LAGQRIASPSEIALCVCEQFIKFRLPLHYLCSPPLAFSAFLQICPAVLPEPLSGAYVHFDDQKGGAITDAFGYYSINGIMPGEYKLKVKYVGYAEFEQKLRISGDQVLNIKLSVKPESLEQVRVYGKDMEESEASSRRAEKNADNITNVLSAQAMQRSPDINAANALSRVSAVTIQRNSGSDDAYAIIRGLEPRYNNTLINDVKVTSPDPVSRFISLSIVPSDLLEKIEKAG
jgi:hypothetical protein